MRPFRSLPTARASLIPPWKENPAIPAEAHHPLTITEYAQIMDAALARTQNFCADQPAQQKVRTAPDRVQVDPEPAACRNHAYIVGLHRNAVSHLSRRNDVY